MTTDLIGLFDAMLPDVSPRWLSTQLSGTPPELAEAVERYGSSWRIQSWTCGVSQVTGEPELVGPGGFSFAFKPSVVEAYHVVPFKFFASDSAVRMELRRVWRLLAQILGSNRAIYTHELMPYEGSNLREIEASIRKRIGPPASNFEELAVAEYFTARAWYVDDFTDLP